MSRYFEVSGDDGSMSGRHGFPTSAKALRRAVVLARELKHVRVYERLNITGRRVLVADCRFHPAGKSKRSVYCRVESDYQPRRYAMSNKKARR